MGDIYEISVTDSWFGNSGKEAESCFEKTEEEKTKKATDTKHYSSNSIFAWLNENPTVEDHKWLQKSSQCNSFNVHYIYKTSLFQKIFRKKFPRFMATTLKLTRSGKTRAI